MLKFGSDEIRKMFQQDDTVVMLNHGAYGLTPRPVLQKRSELLEEQERAPDYWFNVSYEQRYFDAVKASAEFVDCDMEDIFIIDNATSGFNTVLKSINFQRDDEILLTTHSYISAKNTVDELQATKGIVPRVIDIPIPITNEDEVVKVFEDALLSCPRIKVALIDHITSPSALVLPIDILCDICKKRDVLTIIDGAHAPGQLKLSLRNIKADFYVGNFYKWTFAPRSSALLWIAPRHRGTILPLVTSAYSAYSMHHRFSYFGTRDTSNQFTLPHAIEFYKSIGGLEALQRYAEELLTWSQEMLCEALGTNPLPVPKNMVAPFMRVIRLPPLPDKFRDKSGDDMIVHFCLHNSIQVGFFYFSGQCWLRICANVYNRREDYLKLKDALLAMFAGKV